MSAAALAFTLGSAAVAQNLAVVEHPVATNFGSPQGITSGPDGALWFTEYNGNKIGRVSIDGAISDFPLPAQYSFPNGITAGPDGALWFVETGGGSIGRITTAGEITEFPLPSPSSSPVSIATGSDDALWFTENFSNKIGRITPDGSIMEFNIPTPNAFPAGIAAGPDGALWFTENFSGKIGRITTAGTITEFPLALNFKAPFAITAGPDGAMWFTEISYDNFIGRITMNGVITEYPLPSLNSVASGITAGLDGALWFTESPSGAGAQIGRITTAGTITETRLPVDDSAPSGIALGSDGNLWFGEYFTNRIGKLVNTTASLSVSPAIGAPGEPVVISGAGFVGGEHVALFANGTGAEPLGTLTAGADGVISVTSYTRPKPFGGNSLVAVGQSSGAVAVASFFVNPRIRIAATNATQGSTLLLHGLGFSAGDSVDLYWGIPRQYLATVVADKNGGFYQEKAVPVSVPQDASAGINVIYGRGPTTPVVAKGYVTVQ